jgi:uncharacterized membrane protein YqjE
VTAFAAIRRHGAAFLAFVFVVLPVWAFWDTYWFRESREYVTVEHFHAAPSILWCLFITTQAYLIRAGQLTVHRQFGRLSYVLAPTLVITTGAISWGSVTYSDLTDVSLYMLAVRAFLLSSFVIFFALAMLNRKEPQLHARWIACSALVLIDPVLNRITDNFTGLSYTTGIHQFIAFGVMNSLIVVLLVMDLRSGKRHVFVTALILMLLGQTLALTCWDSPTWRAFAESIPPFPFD